MKSASRVEMEIQELRRTGDSGYEDGLVKFRWSSDEHSSAQGAIELWLKVNHSRKEMPNSNGRGGRVVHHLMAATWQPFTVEGEWSDMWGNRVSDPTVKRTGAYAFSTYQDFAGFCRGMPLVRFSLEQLALVGVITDFRIRYMRSTRIGWAITISPEWNENVTVEPPTFSIGKSVPAWLLEVANAGGEINDAHNRMLTAKLAFKKPFTGITAFLLEINDGLDRLQRVGTQGFDTDVERKLLLMATTFRRVRGASLQMAIAVGRLTSSAIVAYNDAMLSFRCAEWIASSNVLAWHMVGLCSDAEVDMRRKAGRGARSLYYPMENEPLEKIAMRFYGNADNWRPIYDANNLTSLILTGDEELIIPARVGS